MRLFKVICLSCGGRHKVFTRDQIMTEEDFVKSQYEERVKDGFVVEVTAEEAKKLGYEVRDSFEHVVTEQDIENNPDGELQLGETIAIPANEVADETLVKKTEDKKPKKASK